MLNNTTKKNIKFGATILKDELVSKVNEGAIGKDSALGIVDGLRLAYIPLFESERIDETFKKEINDLLTDAYETVKWKC
jgi:hypothetical protein